MSKVYVFLIVIVVAAVVAYSGYVYGNKSGYARGYDAGITDAAKVQAGETKVNVDTGYKNPFEKVELNPFKR